MFYREKIIMPSSSIRTVDFWEFNISLCMQLRRFVNYSYDSDSLFLHLGFFHLLVRFIFQN